MKYIVEDWQTEEELKVFDTEEERDEWMDENCEYFSDGAFLIDGRKVCATCDW